MEIKQKLYGLDSTHEGRLPIPDFGVLTIPALRCVGCVEFTAELKLGKGIRSANTVQE